MKRCNQPHRRDARRKAAYTRMANNGPRPQGKNESDKDYLAYIGRRNNAMINTAAKLGA